MAYGTDGEGLDGMGPSRLSFSLYRIMYSANANTWSEAGYLSHQYADPPSAVKGLPLNCINFHFDENNAAFFQRNMQEYIHDHLVGPDQQHARI
jgi:hypothetical protein